MIEELLHQLGAKYGYVQMTMLTDGTGDPTGTLYEVALYEHALSKERLDEMRTGRRLAAYHSSLVSLEDALTKAVA